MTLRLYVVLRAERGGLYFVRFGGPRGTRHDSVENRRVRPSYGLSPAVPAFDRREIKLPLIPAPDATGAEVRLPPLVCSWTGILGALASIV